MHKQGEFVTVLSFYATKNRLLWYRAVVNLGFLMSRLLYMVILLE